MTDRNLADIIDHGESRKKVVKKETIRTFWRIMRATKHRVSAKQLRRTYFMVDRYMKELQERGITLPIDSFRLVLLQMAQDCRTEPRDRTRVEV